MGKTGFQTIVNGFLILALLCGLQGTVWASSNPPAPQVLSMFSSMEQSLFSAHYDSDSLEQRLDRIEKTLYGEARSTLPIEQRISNLQKVYAQEAPPPAAAAPDSSGNANASNDGAYTSSSASSPPVSSASSKGKAAPKKTTRSASAGTAQKGSSKGEEPAFQNFPTQAVTPPSSQLGANHPQTSQAAPQTGPDESDYPTVSTIENKVFGRSFVGEDITQRLQRVEAKVYGNSQQGSLEDRVDGLRLSVLGDTGSAPPPQQQASGNMGQGGYNGPVYNPQYNGDPSTSFSGTSGYNGPQGGGSFNGFGNGPGNYATNTEDPNNMAYAPGQGFQTAATGANSPDLVAAITQVEQQVLRKTYPEEPIPARLSRLEDKIFHQPAPVGLSNEERLQRIIAVAAAGGGGTAHNSKTASTLRVVIPLLIMLLPLFL